jgi:hypothetical protein
MSLVYHSAALRHDKTAWALGYNFDEELGNGPFGYSMSPIKVASMDQFYGLDSRRWSRVRHQNPLPSFFMVGKLSNMWPYIRQ